MRPRLWLRWASMAACLNNMCFHPETITYLVTILSFGGGSATGITLVNFEID